MKMQRFAPYIGIIAALAIGVLIAVFSGGTAVVYPPAKTVILDNFPNSKIEQSTPATTTQTVQVTETVIKKPIVAAQAIPITPEQKPIVSVSDTNASLDISASLLRKALVNIICNAPAGGRTHSISGSGIIIDPKGIILTNAHIGQYFLLADRGVSCVIRSGNPAVDKYNASPIYISPLWLRTNPEVLTKTSPSGTGEYDFALLAISKSATAEPLPSSFPYITLATTPPSAGTPVVIASYGAQFIESSQIASNLFPTIVFGSVKEIFTFAVNTIDVIALGGSAAAQEGSSGGGVADASGNLVGTITTSTVSGATDTRSLNAITASYIRAEYASEMGSALDLLLAESPATAISEFAPQIPALEAIITANLD